MASNSNGSSNQINVPQARSALDNMKYEIAQETGVNLKQGYNGDLTSREAGTIGGNMVKRLVQQAEQQMASTGQIPGATASDQTANPPQGQRV